MQNLQVISGNDSSKVVPEVLVEGVRLGILETFEMICGELPANASTTEEETSDGMVGMMSFAGDLPWSLMLLMPKKTAIEFSGIFAGTEIAFDSPDMGDMIGELTNVISGPITAQLEKLGVKAQMSLPTVARGNDVQLLIPADLPTSDICFTAKGHKFCVKIVAVVSNRYCDMGKGTESPDQETCQTPTSN